MVQPVARYLLDFYLARLFQIERSVYKLHWLSFPQRPNILGSHNPTCPAAKRVQVKKKSVSDKVMNIVGVVQKVKEWKVSWETESQKEGI